MIISLIFAGNSLSFLKIFLQNRCQFFARWKTKFMIAAFKEEKPI
ncbi:unknown protein [Parachlamydia acanthamoebae UV-7]|uniref:Uncharacterized protein n=2 Tax=Parachlamydia acanthamoebae TaxID=83552 RepID=F8KZS7_PARAV|nr:hypothetical protein DB43_FN00070 [Parachlamydia acanthamoebae]CCB86435.1 unknown protein [Parachlamydia acanthamoebae UV-7]